MNNNHEPADDYDETELHGDALDDDYLHPSVDRLVQISESLEEIGDSEANANSNLANGTVYKRDRLNLDEKYSLAPVLATEFARLEHTTQNPALIMVMYEGLIFKTLCDLHAQTRSRNRFKELSRFFMVGCGVLLSMSVYLLTR